ncbi:two-component system regulatory protein YycI [Lysinibacillus capsici]|uniref:Two-component system regulatory protein YycI n=1 Tax=Lysinibacillus capsici TaxID=2115968 RepID=A0ABY8KD45_9BACI|nr:two-component system regulatory protein YycI [Lysinibacillus capsici]MDP1395665.1 two-component system regulatory protein YycI [Lysinibacillus capsici]MDP1416128.1 two-component system regulatory protein YycI [Lysinibacillus capsici]MDP1432027.1 two-component system regulatory protein YycI [Lysinibacillus capsici]WGF37055.1 two-component system regulatory protein YycI [Lysinibacillus capsici]
MDWNRTKSIFIFVFLILNIFLYSLYVNRYNEAKDIEVPGERTIEARLKDDNITYGTLPNNIESASYMTAQVHKFTPAEFSNSNQQVKFKDDNNTKARVIFMRPVKLRNVSDDASFTDFVLANIIEGASYALWKIDREERVAIFFQKTNNRMFYYSGSLKIKWNANNEVTMYEQTMIDNIEEMEQQETVIPPLQIIQTLYAKGPLKPDSRITQMKLGYSTLVKLTRTQVLVPTWEVQVKLSDGTKEEYFVNAVEGKVIEIQEDKQESEEEDWGVE